MTWLSFAVVFALFFVTHSIPVRPAIKSRVTAHIGVRGFSIAYALLSTGMLSLLIWAAAQAPFVQIWPQMIWHRHAVHLGMLIVCLIMAFTVARPNPFSFGGANNGKFDPARPGIIRITRHPVLLALALWAALHLLPNGDLAHVLLFGVLGSFAIAGRTLINRRKQREMGERAWHSLNAATAQAPLYSTPKSLPETVLRVVASVVVFATLLALHPLIIGVSAL